MKSKIHYKGDISMNGLKVALLLSLVSLPLAASSGNCCDRVTSDQNNDERSELIGLALFDMFMAYEASTAYVTISNYNVMTGALMATAGWSFVNSYLPTVFGRQPDLQTNNEISYVFIRGNASIFGWFELLAQLETQCAMVQSTLDAHPECTGGTITYGLNK